MASESSFQQGMNGNSGAAKANEAQAGMPARSILSIEEGRRRKSMTEKPIHCDAERCGRPANCSVELHFFCLGHFISYCYDRLAQCGKVPAGDTSDEIASSTDGFLQECTLQAAVLVDPIRGFDNLERARLFDIFLWASELAAKRSAFTRPQVMDAGYRIARR